MVCSDPESGTDHSLKEVSAYIIYLQGAYTGPQISFCALLCIFTNDINVSVKNSSAEGIC